MTAANRLEIRTLEPHAAPATFADDVRDGLTASPKTLEPKYFYDALGSTLFEAICLLPEYYLTRAETEILERFADRIVDRLEGSIELLELGSGNAQKTRYIVDAVLERQVRLHYSMVDISPAALESASTAMLDAYPAISVTAYASDYMGALEDIARASGRQADRRLALFLGSNIGNLDTASAAAFLGALRDGMRPGDALLLGADLKKDRNVLEQAYDDPLGVTAAFNLNLLARINRELDADFDVSAFRHRAVYFEDEGCVRMYLESQKEQDVTIRALDLDIAFASGETIHTEDSRKYSVADIASLASASGFELVETWLDGGSRFSSNLLIAGG